MTANGNGLEELTFSERVAVDNYRGAMTGALAAADSIADKVVTAAISVATAYGAVIVLVAPKDSNTPLQAVLPFIPLACAVGLALYAQSIGIAIDPQDEVAAVRDRIQRTIGSKRTWGRVALAVLVVGLIMAGWVVYSFYGQSAKPEVATPAEVELYLTPGGTAAVELACGKDDVKVLSGQVEDVETLTSARVSVKVTKAECPSGAGNVVLPQRMIAATKIV
jgi:hypothetical protein